MTMFRAKLIVVGSLLIVAAWGLSTVLALVP